jgi:hypothetical protein
LRLILEQPSTHGKETANHSVVEGDKLLLTEDLLEKIHFKTSVGEVEEDMEPKASFQPIEEADQASNQVEKEENNLAQLAKTKVTKQAAKNSNAIQCFRYDN